jgi:hypothetical protein
VELDRKRVEEALEKLKSSKLRLESFERGMEASGRNEHCLTEPDALLMRSGREGTVLGYNVQTATDAETGLIVHHEVTQAQGDTNQLLPHAEQAKAALGVERLEVLADRGYSNGEHLQACEAQGITATVPRRMIPGSKAEFQKPHFRYEPEQDRYRCPAGELLLRKKTDKRRKLYVYQRSGCNACPMQGRCTRSDRRTITRHFHEAAYERSQARLQADPSLVNRRMSIAERPFAVLKHLMAFRRFNCRGLRNVQTEMSIAVLAYNLKQMISRLGAPRLLGLLS